MVGMTRIDFDVNPAELFRNVPREAYTRPPTTYEAMQVNGDILVPEANAITFYDTKKIEKAVEEDLRTTFGEDYERMIGSVKKQLRIDKDFRNKLGLAEDYTDRTKIISVSSLSKAFRVTLLLNKDYVFEVLQYLDTSEKFARDYEETPLYTNAREITPKVYQVPIKTGPELSAEELKELEEKSFRETREVLPSQDVDSRLDYLENQASPGSN